MTEVEFDEFCDPNNPRKIIYEDILAASRRIAGTVVRTPCTKSFMSEKLGVELYLKQEFLQYTGSFKERGVRNTLLCLNDDQKKQGVICATTGNHGLAMSHHSTQLGIPCIIVMPTTTPIIKRLKCESYGAKIILHGDNISQAKTHAMTIAKERKMFYVNGYDHPNVIQGQGTIGLEILEQVPNVDVVLVPIGGGSLSTGVAVAVKHLKPEIEVYGVETDKTASMAEALRKNERVFYKIDSTLADGLSVNVVGANTFHNLKQGIVDKLIVVKEEWVARTILHFVEEERFVVEGAGAATTAAIFAGLLPQIKGKKVVAVVTGGNINYNILSRALERGLAAEGRLVKFKVTVSDKPSSLAELIGLLANMDISVQDCLPERAWVKSDVFSCVVKMVVETKGWEHAKEMIQQIKNKYTVYDFTELEEAAKSASVRRGPCLAPTPVCMQK